METVIVMERLDCRLVVLVTVWWMVLVLDDVMPIVEVAEVSDVQSVA